LTEQLTWKERKEKINLFAPKVLSGRGFYCGLLNDAVCSSYKIMWKGKKTGYQLNVQDLEGSDGESV
jgi:hypothetical protein